MTNSTCLGFDSADLGEIGRTEFQIRLIQPMRGSIPPIWASRVSIRLILATRASIRRTVFQIRLIQPIRASI